MINYGPVAIFDSGVGGLSVLRHIQRLLPHEDLIYVADQGHVPYGRRPASQIRDFSLGITRFCLEQGAKMIVVACNTATAAGLHELRGAFPKTPFVGMEPAVKPGAAATRSGRVGVLATAGTFQSQRYADLMARFARDVILYENPCHGLVPLIEAGQLQEPETANLLQSCLRPMLDAGVDTIVLGCTHYPFVLPTIRAIAGPEVTIIDPAAAVARQTQHLLQQHQLQRPGDEPARLDAYTSGDPSTFARLARLLLGAEIAVRHLCWEQGSLYLCQ